MAVGFWKDIEIQREVEPQNEEYLNNVKNLQVGQGSKVFRMDRRGFWLGAEEPASAPFTVDMDGNVTLTSITTLTGFTDQDLTSVSLPTNGIRVDSNGIYGRKSGATTFSIDTNGDAFFEGDIDASNITGTTITGGTIQTATTGLRLVMDGDNNAYEFRSGSTLLSQLVSTSVPYSGVSGARFEHGTQTIGIEISGSATALGSRQIVMANDTGTKYFGMIETINQTDVYLVNNLDVDSDWIPYSDASYSLGSLSKKWNNVYAHSIVLNESGGGSNTVTLDAPSVGSNITLTLPNDTGSSGEFLKTDGSGNMSWDTPGTSGANTSLSNLSSVAINTDLISDSDNVDDLGSTSKHWNDTYTGNVRLRNNEGVIYYNNNSALNFFASRIELGSLYDELAPDSSLSANLGSSSRRWNAMWGDTLDLNGGIEVGGDIDMNGNNIDELDEIFFNSNTGNPGTEGQMHYYDSGGSQEFQCNAGGFEGSIDLTAT